MSPSRQLAFDFLSLYVHERHEIIRSFGLWVDDPKLRDLDRGVEFIRAVRERGEIETLRERVAEAYARRPAR